MDLKRSMCMNKPFNFSTWTQHKIRKCHKFPRGPSKYRQISNLFVDPVARTNFSRAVDAYSKWEVWRDCSHVGYY